MQEPTIFDSLLDDTPAPSEKQVFTTSAPVTNTEIDVEAIIERNKAHLLSIPEVQQLQSTTPYPEVFNQIFCRCRIPDLDTVFDTCMAMYEGQTKVAPVEKSKMELWREKQASERAMREAAVNKAQVDAANVEWREAIRQRDEVRKQWQEKDRLHREAKNANLEDWDRYVESLRVRFQSLKNKN